MTNKTQWYGIDVSKWNKSIKWDRVKDYIDFAIIRAGYGKNHIDPKFHENAIACTNYEIPFGIYWFSYALTPEEAKAEANFAVDATANYHLDYPIFYDFEYDSQNNAKRCRGLELSDSEYNALVRAFCKQVEKRGFYASNYVNKDYFARLDAQTKDKYDVWFADYQCKKESILHNLCQYTSRGKMPGISGYVDLNTSNRDYPGIIAKAKLNRYTPNNGK